MGKTNMTINNNIYTGLSIVLAAALGGFGLYLQQNPDVAHIDLAKAGAAAAVPAIFALVTLLHPSPVSSTSTPPTQK